MTKEWNVTDSAGNIHKIQCKLGLGNKVIIDNDSYKLKSSNWFINVVDYQINLPGAVCNLVVIGNNPKLAVNGVYLDDGKPYEPVSNVPVWVWVLVAISCIGGWFFAGFIGLGIGAICSGLALTAILNKKPALAVIFPVLSIVVSVIIMFLMLPLVNNLYGYY